MLFKNAILASLAASVLAVPMHKHHEHKRDITTVYVTAGVDAGVQKAAATSAPAPAPAASAASSLAPSASASAPAPSSSSVGAAGAKGVTYTPYTSGPCKTAEQVKQEISQLSGYDVIRLYGCDCNQVENVLAALAPGQKVILGVFNVDNLASELLTITGAVNGKWDVVDTVTIGNELVNSGQKLAAAIKGYVDQARSTLKAAGFSGPVTTVDTFIATINNPELCDAGDYVAINAHAFFDGGYAAENAGDWLQEQIQRVTTACPNKKVVVTESGWPWQGSANKLAVPSKENQAAAIASIKNKCGADTILFASFDEEWKQDSGATFGAEKYWGINH